MWMTCCAPSGASRGAHTLADDNHGKQTPIQEGAHMYTCAQTHTPTHLTLRHAVSHQLKSLEKKESIQPGEFKTHDGAKRKKNPQGWFYYGQTHRVFNLSSLPAPSFPPTALFVFFVPRVQGSSAYDRATGVSITSRQ